MDQQQHEYWCALEHDGPRCESEWMGPDGDDGGALVRYLPDNAVELSVHDADDHSVTIVLTGAQLHELRDAFGWSGA